jgi:flagellar biosynthesis protein FliQ
MGINKVLGMCIGNSCHNMLSVLLVTTATTNNTITTIDKILVGMFMLILLTPWDISDLIAMATLFDLL